MSQDSAPRGPSPWLSVGISLAVTVGGLLWATATRNADLAYLQARMERVEAKNASLEARANTGDVTIAGMSKDLEYIRQSLGEIKESLGIRPTPKFVNAK